MAKKTQTVPASENPKNDPQPISSNPNNVGVINERPFLVPVKP